MIYVLPGMGADHRMYPAPWRGLPDSVFIDWPTYQREKTLADVAKSVVREYAIAENAWLIGSSLGGMVACEIAQLVPVRGLILVGSAKSKDEMGAFLALLGSIVDLVPLVFLQQLAGKIPAELMQMFKNSDPAFVRAMCHAIIAWEGLPTQAIEPYRIHGRHDLIFPLPKMVDRVIDGGHLIAMTHAEECVAAVKTIMAGQLSNEGPPQQV